jgi:DNA modification methylase
MELHVPSQSVDLVYLDPPFNSDQNYNVLFKERDGRRSASQILAFEDTWEWTIEAEEQFEKLVERSDRIADVMRSFRSFLSTSDMMAYLVMMAPRLIELKRVMRPGASIYLHCDPTASHYLKILMDAAFGPENFRSEIIWKRTNTHSDAKRWSPVSDTILYYSKGAPKTWNPPYLPHGEEYLKSKYRHKDSRGVYRLDNMTSPKPRPNMMYEWKGFPSPANGWRYSKETMAKLDSEDRIWYPDSKLKRPQLKRYLEAMSGVLMGNVWTDIPPLNSQAQERLGYPTQKPQDLLERIIQASSNVGDVVLDPFCGCGTGVEAAHKLGRNWIGIDITHLAIGLIKYRLQNAFGDSVWNEFETVGEPVTVEDASQLASDDPMQFQHWSLGLVGARSSEPKKGMDRGVDGRLYFHDERVGDSKQIIFSVKSGKLSPSYVRDLRGVIERDRAQIGVLITLHKPTAEMLKDAAAAGFYVSAWGKHPRIQIINVERLLSGETINRPPTREVDPTLKKRTRSVAAAAEQLRLPK